MELKGTFAPPAVGSTAVPIPMVGEGELNLTDAQLQARGFKKPFNPLMLLVPVAVVAGIFFYAVVATMLNLPAGVTKFVAIAIVGGIVTVALRRNAKVGKNAQPWALDIPWKSISKVHEDPQLRGALVIHVKKFSPKGTLHFVPSQGGSTLELISEIERRSKAA